MPLIRNFRVVKPLKTERTHEENQERAYIAASRRGDRSLEARLTSARRASDIHKRLTGRSLRITEQEVVNQAMYEEQDDYLLAQYRRLIDHMSSESADYVRRLTDYISNHVALRRALWQAVRDSCNEYPDGTPLAQTMQATQLQIETRTHLQLRPHEGLPKVFQAMTAAI